MDRSRGGCGRRNCGICVSVVVLGTLIGCVFLAYTAFASPATGARLEQVIFVFRHGDRTPTETYPNDPYANYEWEGGWGSLTMKGMLQLYLLGQWIRKEYGSVTGDKYRSSNIKALSSYAERCIMSAQALLAGMYPVTREDMFVPGLAWRPIPVHVTPRNFDKIIVVKAPCPRLDVLTAEAYANESLISGETLAPYYKELSMHTGKEMATITDVEFLYNTLEIEKQHGLTLPEWTEKFFNDDMLHIAARSLALFTSNTMLRRLRGGPLLREIVNHMSNAINEEKDTKRVYLYSAHDITLVNLMRTMGFTELLKPDYAATLIIELHSIHGRSSHEVKILYLNNTETNVAHELFVPKCGEPCTLQELKEIWKDVMPVNWDDECQV